MKLLSLRELTWRKHRNGTLMNAGTSDRVILLSGSLHAVLTAVFLMLEKFPIDNGRGGKPKEDAVSAPG